MDLKNNINNRFGDAVSSIISTNKVDSKSDFAKSINISPSKLSEILNNRMNAGTEILAETCRLYNVSERWLMQGVGNMWSDENEPGNSSNKVFIPLIPIEAMAGFFSGDTQVMNYDVDFYQVPEWQDLPVDFAIRVRGDSMITRFYSGDIVACKLITDNIIQWNRIYVLDTDQGPLLKRVQKGGTGKLLLVSENPEYEPFEMPVSSIRSIALVLAGITFE